MPISRKKACARCRAAKARCSLTHPQCSRCAERGLRCEYSEHSRLAPYPGTAAEETTTPIGTPNMSPRFVAEPHASQMELFPSDRLVEEMTPQSTHPFDWDSVTFNNLHPGCILMPNSTLETASPFLGFPGGFNQILNGQYSETTVATTQRSPKPLKLRPSVTPNEFFTTKIMLGQVESYPKMMIGGHTLPPFIHSRCALDEGLSPECYSKRTHQCLPRTLGICASLVQLFYTKTSASSDFVWKTIYAENARLYDEHNSYDSEKLLETLQAICIYVILQAQDQESMERNDAHSLIKTLGDIASTFNDTYGYDGYGDLQGKSFNRNVWMFQESTRRTGCLLYIIETLLDVIIGRDRDPVSCNGYSLMPLPCVRGLWEVRSTSEWIARYKEVSGRMKSDKCLKLTDLKTSMTLSTTRLNRDKGNEGILSDVMAWCEGLDQFGTMVWMAAMLSKC